MNKCIKKRIKETKTIEKENKNEKKYRKKEGRKIEQGCEEEGKTEELVKGNGEGKKLIER